MGADQQGIRSVCIGSANVLVDIMYIIDQLLRRTSLVPRLGSGPPATPVSVDATIP